MTTSDLPESDVAAIADALIAKTNRSELKWTAFPDTSQDEEYAVDTENFNYYVALSDDEWEGSKARLEIWKRRAAPEGKHLQVATLSGGSDSPVMKLFTVVRRHTLGLQTLKDDVLNDLGLG